MKGAPSAALFFLMAGAVAIMSGAVDVGPWWGVALIVFAAWWDINARLNEVRDRADRNR